MNVKYNDGREAELLRNLNGDEAADLLRKRLNDPGVESVNVFRDDSPSGPYPNNRQGRRRWQRELRREAVNR